jgi:hypothetical protein
MWQFIEFELVKEFLCRGLRANVLAGGSSAAHTYMATRWVSTGNLG